MTALLCPPLSQVRRISSLVGSMSRGVSWMTRKRASREPPGFLWPTVSVMWIWRLVVN